MTDDELIQDIDESLDKSDDELEDELPALLEQMEGRTEELVREYPETFGRVVQRMETMDIASFVSDNPETADQFQELLWAGMNVLVEESPDVQENIDDDITVNFEAEDCPMEGHLEVDSEEQTMHGGSGRLDDAMLEITGPADTLVGLIVGSVDPIQGFMQQKYQMDGPVHKGTRLAPIMNSLSEKVPAES
ncbi:MULTISPECIES: SCP2 sterol-binding domain-containing protein [Natrialbaceae]|uniref:SCP2 sterol-binding domain-containing protein n=1 Tax=Natrialbaceae TaxID=1644061 RepID=UPI00207CA403|nr:SCP2 sterol-binding domain-containing protein [Natronococcus sp. CG52]